MSSSMPLRLPLFDAKKPRSSVGWNTMPKSLPIELIGDFRFTGSDQLPSESTVVTKISKPPIPP